MGDENPIRTLGDYSKPSHEGYRNTIDLPVGNNVVPLRSDTIRLVQNGCSFHGLRNWLERVPAGSITTWEDLTTHFLAQFFPSGRTAKLRNDILMFQQHHGESLSEAWTRFKDLLQKVPHNGIDLWLQALLEDLTLFDNESWNDPRDFAKSVKPIALPQDVPNTSGRRLIELENQVQRLMEAHLALTQPTKVNKITISCEICSGSHDTQYCMEDPEQAFVEYASSRTDEAGEGPETPLLVGRGFLAIANAVIDCRKAKIAVGEGITRSIFGVKGVDLGEEEATYWTTLGKRESYKPRPSSDGVGAQTPYYARKDFLDCHLPEEWEIDRDDELNPFKDVLVFRRMVEFLGAIPINLKSNIWVSEDSIKNPIN
ncbi:MAK10-like protein [Tanacetum coccineum]|uniref:MAK10-like protein n=1 Tax=Tanacetum coccineum TaxID=301880 RepID=A0ABQ5C5T5_9ASTR